MSKKDEGDPLATTTSMDGLQHVSTVSKEDVPAVLALATADEVARGCPPHVLQAAYAIQAGVNRTLEAMQKAKWVRRTTPMSRGNLSAPVLSTRDPAMIEAYQSGELAKLISVLIQPTNPNHPIIATTTLDCNNGEVSIGGQHAAQWLAFNRVGPSAHIPTAPAK